MPKVHKIEHARKDYPEHDIKKGDTYYKWSLKTGPYSSREYKSKTYPNRRQLTLNEFQLALYDLEDQRDGITADHPLDLETARDELASAIRDLANEQQEKLDNMPEGLQQGSSGELLSERVSNLEAWADEIESVEIPDWSEDEDETDPDDDEDETDRDPDDEETELDGSDTDREDALNDALEEVKGCEYPG